MTDATGRRGGSSVEIEQLEVSRGGHPLFRVDSVSIAPGSVVAVVGRSGCGKSTLLRLLAGLPIGRQFTVSGTISVDGMEPTSFRRGGGLSFAFQDSRLLPWATALENADLGVQLLGGRRQIQPGAARRALGAAGLEEEFFEIKAHRLSGGQRNRVALARSIASLPRLLLLDEPLAGLDEMSRTEIAGGLRGSLLHGPATVLAVTHNITEAASFADHAICFPEDEAVGLKYLEASTRFDEEELRRAISNAETLRSRSVGEP